MASPTPTPEERRRGVTVGDGELSRPKVAFLPEVSVRLSSPTLKTAIPEIISQIPNPNEIAIDIIFGKDAGHRNIIESEKYTQAIGELIQYALLDAQNTVAKDEGINLKVTHYNNGHVGIEIETSRKGEELSSRSSRSEYQAALNDRLKALGAELTIYDELATELGSKEGVNGKSRALLFFETELAQGIPLKFGDHSLSIEPGTTIQGVLEQFAQEEKIASLDDVLVVKFKELGQDDGRTRIIARADFDIELEDSFEIEIAHSQPKTEFDPSLQVLLDAPSTDLTDDHQKVLQTILEFGSYREEECASYVGRLLSEERAPIAKALVALSADETIVKSEHQQKNLRAALITLGEEALPHLINALEDQIANGWVKSRYSVGNRMPSDTAGFLVNVIKNLGDKRGSVVLARAALALDWSEMMDDRGKIHIASDDRMSDIKTHSLGDFSGEIMAPALLYGSLAEHHGHMSSRSSGRNWYTDGLYDLDTIPEKECSTLINMWCEALKVGGMNTRLFFSARREGGAEQERFDKARNQAESLGYLIGHQLSLMEPYLKNEFKAHITPLVLESCYSQRDQFKDQQEELREPWQTVLAQLTQEERVDCFFDPLLRGELALEEVPRQVFEESKESGYRREELTIHLRDELREADSEGKAQLLRVATIFGDKSFLPVAKGALGIDNYSSLYDTLKALDGEGALLELHKLLSEQVDNEATAEVQELRKFFVDRACDLTSGLAKEGKSIEEAQGISPEELQRMKVDVASFLGSNPDDEDRFEFHDGSCLRAISLLQLEGSYLSTIQRIFNDRNREDGWFDRISAALAATPPSEERDRFVLEVIEHYENNRSVEFDNHYRIPEDGVQARNTGIGAFSRNLSEENLVLLKSMAKNAKSYEVLRQVLPRLYDYGPDPLIEVYEESMDLNLLVTHDEHLFGDNAQRQEAFATHPQLRNYFVSKLNSYALNGYAAVRPTNWGITANEASIFPVVLWLRDILFDEMTLAIPGKKTRNPFSELRIQRDSAQVFREIFRKKLGYDLSAYKANTPEPSRSAAHAMDYLLHRDKAYYVSMGETFPEALEVLKSRGYFREDSPPDTTPDEVPKLLAEAPSK